MIGEHSDVAYAEISAPSFLGERQIHADGVKTDIRKATGRLLEAFRLGVTNWSVERRYHAEDPDPMAGLFEIHFLQRAIYYFKIWRFIAYVKFGTA